MSTRPVSSEREGEIGAVLTAVVGLSRALSAPRSTPFGDEALTRTQLDILFLLAHATSPLTPGSLAEALRVTRGAITQAVDQLRLARLVERTAAEHDARSRVLSLAPAARAQVEAFEAATVHRVAHWFAELSDHDLGVLAALITRVKADR